MVDVINPASFVNSEVLIVEVAIVVTDPLSLATISEPNVQGVDEASPEPPVTVKSPDPSTDEPFMVLILVQETKISCLLPRAVEVDTVCNVPEPT